MSELLRHLRQVTDDLDSIGARYALVGGIAVSLRTEPRFTRDLDIAVAVESDQGAERLGHALLQRGYRIIAQVEQDEAGRLATLRLAPPIESGILVDLLFASCGIEPEIVEQADRIEILEGWTAPVARAWHLLAMKLLAADPDTRPQDMVDARALLTVMTPDDVERARSALDLIEQRSFNRKKDLKSELGLLQHRFSGNA